LTVADRGIFTTRKPVLSGSEQSRKRPVAWLKKKSFPNENGIYLPHQTESIFFGTEAAMNMVRDTSPADVNLKE
jgi:hypothetical protein